MRFILALALVLPAEGFAEDGKPARKRYKAAVQRVLQTYENSTSSPSAGAAQSLELNRKLVDFSVKRLGKQVGNGDCYAFAINALMNSGGARGFRDNPGAGDYVWGKLVYYQERNKSGTKSSGAKQFIFPGDIVQFRNCQFSGKGWWYGFGHHTAVIVATANGGDALRILHQNHNGKKSVTALTIRAHTLEKGWFRVYRPQPTDKPKR